ncbi:MAG: hypothetical protein ACK5LL_00255 [Suipraeoptans sp.]
MKKNTLNLKTTQKLSKLMRKYTEGYTASGEAQIKMGTMIFKILRSPDYKFKDFIAIVVNGYLKNESLTCTVIPNTSHIPGMNGMKAIFNEFSKL